MNSLAIEFVDQLDEAIAASSWFDPDSRLIRAGAFELVIRRHLVQYKLEKLRDLFPRGERRGQRSKNPVIAESINFLEDHEQEFGTENVAKTVGKVRQDPAFRALLQKAIKKIEKKPVLFGFFNRRKRSVNQTLGSEYFETNIVFGRHQHFLEGVDWESEQLLFQPRPDSFREIKVRARWDSSAYARRDNTSRMPPSLSPPQPKKYRDWGCDKNAPLVSLETVTFEADNKKGIHLSTLHEVKSRLVMKGRIRRRLRAASNYEMTRAESAITVAYIYGFALWESFSAIIVLIFPLFVVWFLVFVPNCYHRVIQVCGYDA